MLGGGALLPLALDIDRAIEIAEEYLARLKADGARQISLFRDRTIERDFGWTFFYGPSDSSILAAGNAPFIVDRRDGSIHVTGTAYPTEEYLESYARVGRVRNAISIINSLIINSLRMQSATVAPFSRQQSATKNGQIHPAIFRHRRVEKDLLSRYEQRRESCKDTVSGQSRREAFDFDPNALPLVPLLILAKPQDTAVMGHNHRTALAISMGCRS